MAYGDAPRDPLNFGVINVIEPADTTAYDFLLSSKLRNEMYNRHMASGANQAYALWNAAITKLDFKYLNMGSLGISYTVKFADGSLIEVFPNMTSNTLEDVEGTARDRDGNTIPTSRSGMIGEYEVSDANLDNFAEYLSYYNIEFDKGISCSQYSTKVISVSDGTLAYVIDSCIF